MGELQRQLGRARLIESIKAQAKYLSIGEKELRRLLEKKYRANALCFLTDEDVVDFLDYLKEQEPGSPLGTQTLFPPEGCEF